MKKEGSVRDNGDGGNPVAVVVSVELADFSFRIVAVDRPYVELHIRPIM